jgi:hypothetical protein
MLVRLQNALSASHSCYAEHVLHACACVLPFAETYAFRLAATDRLNAIDRTRLLPATKYGNQGDYALTVTLTDKNTQAT